MEENFVKTVGNLRFERRADGVPVITNEYGAVIKLEKEFMEQYQDALHDLAAWVA